jgi:hypothetical protein
VTTIEDVRPAGNFAKPLFEIAAERKWTRIGVLDLEQISYDLYKALHGGSLDLVNVESPAVFSPAEDENELAVRRKAVALAMRILEEEIPNGLGMVDHRFVGTLERRFRRAGAEDLIVLVTNGKTPPAPPTGATLEENFSVSVAVEYRGHWVRISRPHIAAKATTPALPATDACVEKLDGSYPYELGSGKIMGRNVEYTHNGKRLFYGDTIL